MIQLKASLQYVKSSPYLKCTFVSVRILHDHEFLNKTSSSVFHFTIQFVL